MSKYCYFLLILCIVLGLWGCTPAQPSTHSTTNSPEPSMCSHDYTPQVTLEANCLQEGTMQYRCSLCGDTREEIISATGHDFRVGICLSCGAEEEGIRSLSEGEWMLLGLDEEGTRLYWISMQLFEVGGDMSVKCFTLLPEYGVSGRNVDVTAPFEYMGKQYYYESEEILGSFLYRKKDGIITITFDHKNKDATILLERTNEHQLTLAANAEGFANSSITDVINTVGMFTCEHYYEGTILSAMTCQQTGVLEYTCSVCCDQFTETIPPQHSYVNGVCSVCNFAAPYCELSQGTWVSASPLPLGLNVFHLSFLQKGDWGYDLLLTSFHSKEAGELKENLFAQGAISSYIYEDTVYSANFAHTTSYYVTITEDGDTVYLVFGIGLGDNGLPPYHACSTVTLRRIGNNQFIVTDSEFYWGILHQGAILTCYDA